MHVWNCWRSARICQTGKIWNIFSISAMNIIINTKNISCCCKIWSSITYNICFKPSSTSYNQVIKLLIFSQKLFSCAVIANIACIVAYTISRSKWSSRPFSSMQLHSIVTQQPSKYICSIQPTICFYIFNLGCPTFFKCCYIRNYYQSNPTKRANSKNQWYNQFSFSWCYIRAPTVS